MTASAGWVGQPGIIDQMKMILIDILGGEVTRMVWSERLQFSVEISLWQDFGSSELATLAPQSGAGHVQDLLGCRQ
ncbi:hypothetical protein [Herbaspirillum sp. B65]|uniref:hypothetical protein n=1 Tax=Herbaspirillum sp. B65 TaxID=137708 RepID=UPI0011D180DB|nr:hypothetical protein [Herbaspirillum sp. B65]